MENKTMTEKEIIQYWVNNRKEMRAFIAAPKECQEWLSTHAGVMNTKQLNGGGEWIIFGVPDSHKQLLSHVVYSLIEIKEVGFIEFNIDEKGMFQHQYQSPAQYKKTYWYKFLEAVPSIGIFGGWFFENKAGAGWSIFQMGETSSGGWTTIADDWVKPLVPKKIRFYKG